MVEYPEAMSQLSRYPKALSHAESGGGNVNLKTIVVTNAEDSVAALRIAGGIVDGVYDTVTIEAGETKTVTYVEQTDAYNNVSQPYYKKMAMFASGSNELAAVSADAGLSVADKEVILIETTAADGAKITVKLSESGSAA